jgi:hypothetical protein
MTKATPSTSPLAAKPALLVFGLDQSGKPKAGRFAGAQAEPARKAAASLKLKIVEVHRRPDLEELSKKIPVGRVHGRGMTFISNIKRDLYDQRLPPV